MELETAWETLGRKLKELKKQEIKKENTQIKIKEDKEMNKTTNFEEFKKEMGDQLKIVLSKLQIGYGEKIQDNIDLWATNKKWMYEKFIKHENYIGDGKIKIEYKRKKPIDVARLKGDELKCTPARELITQWEQEKGWDKYNAYMQDGSKKSRVMLKYIKEWYEKYNKENGKEWELSPRQEAIIGDCFKTTIDEKIILSINPVDYVTMSCGENWNSCANPDNVKELLKTPTGIGGNSATCGTGGIIAQMLDKTTMVAYKEGHIDTQGIGIMRKIWRMLIHWNEEGTQAIFNRLYPQNSKIEEKYILANRIATEIKKLNGKENEVWIMLNKERLNYDTTEYIKGGVQYRDLEESYCKPIIMKTEDDETIMQVGEKINTIFGLVNENANKEDITNQYYNMIHKGYVMNENKEETKVFINEWQDIDKGIMVNGTLEMECDCVFFKGKYELKESLKKVDNGYIEKGEEIYKLYNGERTFIVSKEFAQKYIQVCGKTYATKENVKEEILKDNYIIDNEMYSKERYILINGKIVDKWDIRDHLVYIGEGQFKYFTKLLKKYKESVNNIGSRKVYIKNEELLTEINGILNGIEPIKYKDSYYVNAVALLESYIDNNDLEKYIIVNKNKKVGV